jgi:hypothetical protein
MIRDKTKSLPRYLRLEEDFGSAGFWNHLGNVMWRAITLFGWLLWYEGPSGLGAGRPLWYSSLLGRRSCQARNLEAEHAYHFKDNKIVAIRRIFEDMSTPKHGYKYCFGIPRSLKNCEIWVNITV